MKNYFILFSKQRRCGFKEEKKIEKEEKLMNLYKKNKTNVERVVDIYIEYKINIKDKESYINGFKYDLILCFYIDLKEK